MTLPGEMNLCAVSSPQSHLSTASSVNTANTQGNGRNEPPPRTDCNIYFTLRQQAASSFMYLFSVSGFGVEILPSCGSAVLSLWVVSVPRTVCPGQPTRGGYHKNQVWGLSWLQDCSLQLNRKALWLPKWKEQQGYRPASTVWHESQIQVYAQHTHACVYVFCDANRGSAIMDTSSRMSSHEAVCEIALSVLCLHASGRTYSYKLS